MLTVSRHLARLGWALAAAWPLLAAHHPASAQSVAAYHGGAGRSGHFTMSGFTWERVRGLRLDPGFAPRFAGHLYAQPLYWKPAGRQTGLLIVASENNTVAAIDAGDGKTAWSRSLGAPAPLSAFPCGNIDPLGITGTPVIDERSGTLYLDAMVAEAPGLRHRLYALSLADGAVQPGWPVEVDKALRAAGYGFDSRVQNQRGALTILNGALYVPYGGFFGDCGDYRGWVVGVRLNDPAHPFAWQSRARGAGIWAPGGLASDGTSLYAATGNTIGAARWRDGEAVLRLAPDLQHSEHPSDFFAPTDWRALDERDADLGGSNPLPLDLPASGGAQPVVLALGKDRRAYLLDRRHLGGIGGSLLAAVVSTGPIRTAPATYAADGAAYVAIEGAGERCPGWFNRGGLTMLRLRAGAPPSIETAWCGAPGASGGPIVTTTDGKSANPIVWILGAERDNRLYGLRGDTGEVLFTGPPLAGLRHFQTLIAADDRLFVGADGRLYAFALPP